MAAVKSKNLDIHNLYLLNTSSKLVLAVLTVIAIVGIAYFALFKEQMEQLSSLKNKENELKETYKQKSIEAASLDNLQAELSSIRSAFDVLLKQLPTDAEIPNLIQELHQAGSANGLRLDSVIPKDPANDGPIQNLPYEISITGKYGQISRFARDVGKLSRIITLESLNIGHPADSKNGKSDMLTLKATATTYKALNEAEMSAAKNDGEGGEDTQPDTEQQ